jgi:excisionase family DNA binding protein
MLLPKTIDDAPQQEWLNLSQAAKRLGVHLSTLRRWADSGAIPYMLTPGGHRRFAASDVEAFARHHRHIAKGTGIEQLWAERAMKQTRQGLEGQRHSRWFQAYDEEHREKERALGRRLMGVVMQYLSSEGNSDDLINEARTLGREYARTAIALGLPMVAALEAAMFFHNAMLEVAVQLPQTTHLPADANTNLLRKINTVLNAVQLTIAQAYEEVDRV